MVGKSDSLCICRCRVHIGYDDVVDDTDEPSESDTDNASPNP